MYQNLEKGISGSENTLENGNPISSLASLSGGTSSSVKLTAIFLPKPDDPGKFILVSDKPSTLTLLEQSDLNPKVCITPIDLAEISKYHKLHSNGTDCVSNSTFSETEPTSHTQRTAVSDLNERTVDLETSASAIGFRKRRKISEQSLQIQDEEKEKNYLFERSNSTIGSDPEETLISDITIADESEEVCGFAPHDFERSWERSKNEKAMDSILAIDQKTSDPVNINEPVDSVLKGQQISNVTTHEKLAEMSSGESDLDDGISELVTEVCKKISTTTKNIANDLTSEKDMVESELLNFTLSEDVNAGASSEITDSFSKLLHEREKESNITDGAFEPEVEKQDKSMKNQLNINDDFSASVPLDGQENVEGSAHDPEVPKGGKGRPKKLKEIDESLDGEENVEVSTHDPEVSKRVEDCAKKLNTADNFLHSEAKETNFSEREDRDKTCKMNFKNEQDEFDNNSQVSADDVKMSERDREHSKELSSTDNSSDSEGKEAGLSEKSNSELPEITSKLVDSKRKDADLISQKRSDSNIEVSAHLPEVPKRGRGRPKKLKETEDSLDDDVSVHDAKVPKRGRGRPKKPKESTDDSLDGDVSVHDPEVPKRGRGRPKKPKESTDDSLDGDVSVHDPEVPKRGRGRPKKPKESTDDSLDGDVSVQDPEVPKRGRGRPKKPKESTDDSLDGDVSVHDPEVPKRGRGRPKKPKESTDDSLDGEVSTHDPEVPKRGRGRPKKLDATNSSFDSEEKEKEISEKSNSELSNITDELPQSEIEEVQNKISQNKSNNNDQVFAHIPELSKIGSDHPKNLTSTDDSLDSLEKEINDGAKCDQNDSDMDVEVSQVFNKGRKKLFKRKSSDDFLDSCEMKDDLSSYNKGSRKKVKTNCIFEDGNRYSEYLETGDDEATDLNKNVDLLHLMSECSITLTDESVEKKLAKQPNLNPKVCIGPMLKLHGETSLMKSVDADFDVHATENNCSIEDVRKEKFTSAKGETSVSKTCDESGRECPAKQSSIDSNEKRTDLCEESNSNLSCITDELAQSDRDKIRLRKSQNESDCKVEISAHAPKVSKRGRDQLKTTDSFLNSEEKETDSSGKSNSDLIPSITDELAQSEREDRDKISPNEPYSNAPSVPPILKLSESGRGHSETLKSTDDDFLDREVEEKDSCRRLNSKLRSDEKGAKVPDSLSNGCKNNRRSFKRKSDVEENSSEVSSQPEDEDSGIQIKRQRRSLNENTQTKVTFTGECAEDLLDSSEQGNFPECHTTYISGTGCFSKIYLPTPNDHEKCTLVVGEPDQLSLLMQSNINPKVCLSDKIDLSCLRPDGFMEKNGIRSVVEEAADATAVRHLFDDSKEEGLQNNTVDRRKKRGRQKSKTSVAPNNEPLVDSSVEQSNMDEIMTASNFCPESVSEICLPVPSDPEKCVLVVGGSDKINLLKSADLNPKVCLIDFKLSPFGCVAAGSFEIGPNTMDAIVLYEKRWSQSRLSEYRELPSQKKRYSSKNNRNGDRASVTAKRGRKHLLPEPSNEELGITKVPNKSSKSHKKRGRPRKLKRSESEYTPEKDRRCILVYDQTKPEFKRILTVSHMFKKNVISRPMHPHPEVGSVARNESISAPAAEDGNLPCTDVVSLNNHSQECHLGHWENANNCNSSLSSTNELKAFPDKSKLVTRCNRDSNPVTTQAGRTFTDKRPNSCELDNFSEGPENATSIPDTDRLSRIYLPVADDCVLVVGEPDQLNLLMRSNLSPRVCIGTRVHLSYGIVERNDVCSADVTVLNAEEEGDPQCDESASLVMAKEASTIATLAPVFTVNMNILPSTFLALWHHLFHKVIYRFPTYHKQILLLQKLHSISRTYRLPTMYSWTNCFEALNSKVVLCNNMRINRKDKLYRCTICDKDFMRLKFLKCHMKIFHGELYLYKKALPFHRNTRDDVLVNPLVDSSVDPVLCTASENLACSEEEASSLYNCADIPGATPLQEDFVVPDAPFSSNSEDLLKLTPLGEVLDLENEPNAAEFC